ncbi:unnamed protein product [Sphacelaria rigidula]
MCQRFAGGHRAVLVDRLLSAMLSTETLTEFVTSGKLGTSQSGSDHASAPFRNQFDALGGSEDDDYEQSDDEHGVVGGKRPHPFEFEHPWTGDTATHVVEQTCRDSSGGCAASTAPAIISDADKTTFDAKEPALEEGQLNVNFEQDSSSVSVVPTVPSSSQPQTRCGSNHSSDDERTTPDVENSTAGRESVLRLYGSALLRFRVSVFLFCSDPPSVDGDGDDSKQGPRQLTMRRQRVMCSDNLDAVASHLRGDGNILLDERCGGAGAGAVLSSPNWLRVAVGSAALLQGDGSAVSTRVAALLLQRAGERAAGPTSFPAEIMLSRRGCLTEAKPESRRPRRKRVASGPSTPQISWTAAAAEAQFCLNSWPGYDLPKASDKAANMFFPPSLATSRPWHNSTKKRTCDAGRSDRYQAGGKGRKRSNGEDSDDCCSADDRVLCDEENDIDDLSRPHRPRRKRKRSKQQDSSFPSTVTAPPHYAGLINKMPREKRRLLARLGHHGYVKVLENLLDGFVQRPVRPSTFTPTVDNMNTTADPNCTPQARYQPEQLPAESVSSANRPGVSTFASPDKRARQSVDNGVHHEYYRGAVEGVLPGEMGVHHQSKEDRDGAAGENVWDALETGKPHPSLVGLVEPLHLARAGPDRLILPIPNPFYRRVLHALCLVHGLCSQGGDTGEDQEAAAPIAEVGAGAQRRHRTVEITRTASRGRCGTGGDGRDRGRHEGVWAGKLVPVEILLSDG